MQNNYEIHEAAAVWPMLPDDELQELADDIKKNGQQLPILVQGELIIDGRNRLAACELAGVQPTFQEFEGKDVRAFIVSSNERRRHMTKGARAMAVAMMYPKPEKRGRGNKASKNEAFNNIASGYISQARTVLAHSSDEAKLVVLGAKSLAAAYKEVKESNNKAETFEGRFKRLEAAHGDLAQQVVEETLTLEEAEAAARERDEQNRKRIAGLNDSLTVIRNAFGRVSSDVLIKNLGDFINNEHDNIAEDYDPTAVVDTLISQLGKLRGIIHAKKT